MHDMHTGLSCSRGVRTLRPRRTAIFLYSNILQISRLQPASLEKKELRNLQSGRGRSDQISLRAADRGWPSESGRGSCSLSAAAIGTPTPIQRFCSYPDRAARENGPRERTPCVRQHLDSGCHVPYRAPALHRVVLVHLVSARGQARERPVDGMAARGAGRLARAFKWRGGGAPRRP